jgi:YegS/Rv2252/BmrU family lipid kinase
MKTVAIVNPKAAGGTAAVWDRARRHLPSSIEVRETRAVGHGIGLAAEALKTGARIVIAVGGDGTINEVVNGFFEGEHLLAPDAVLGIVPHGTGSDFIRTLGLPADPKLAAEVICRGTAKSIDVGVVRYTSLGGVRASRYFVNVTSFGMGGAVAARAKRYSSVLGGKAGFLASTILTMLSFSGNQITLNLDQSKTIEATITNVAVGNGQFHGAGMWVCPQAIVNDGLLDVSVIHYLNIFELIRNISMLYNGRIFEHPKVEFYRVRHIVAQGDENALIEVDGEPLGKLPLEISILPSAIRVLM